MIRKNLMINEELDLLYNEIYEQEKNKFHL